MLKAIWDKAVHQYQNFQQENDRHYVRAIDEKIEEARKGYYTRVFAAPMVGYAHVAQVKLTPQEAQEMIAEREQIRAEVVKRMEQRREKYGLSI